MNKKGFTLVELLAVIIILAILALLALPRVIKFMESSRVNSFAVEANQIIKSARNAYGNKLLTEEEVSSPVCYTVAELVKLGYLEDSDDVSGAVVIDFVNGGNTDDKEAIYTYLSKTGYYIKKNDPTGKIKIYNNDIVKSEGKNLFRDCTSTCTATNGGLSIMCDDTEITEITPASLDEPLLTCDFENGTEWDFDYKGSIDEFEIPCTGIYKLEVWGAQGGGSPGGKGGYAYGNKVLIKDDKAYIGVGGRASTFNGGGSCSSTTGGGGTHIGMTNTQIADTNIAKLYVVAGGGGGYSGGAGGGLTGGRGGDGNYADNHGVGGNGGTQIAGGASRTASSGDYGNRSSNPGSFGKGGSCSYYGNATSRGGGGGGYYGGAGGMANGYQSSAGGGGGSSYIGGVDDGDTTSGVQTGNGKAKITLVEAFKKMSQAVTCDSAEIGDIWTYSYTGETKTFEVPCSGVYEVTVSGARGGISTYSNDGYTYYNDTCGSDGKYTIGSSYVSGRFKLYTSSNVTYVIGGNGVNTTHGNGTGGSPTDGGWNGGSRGSCGGGTGSGGFSALYIDGTEALKSKGGSGAWIGYACYTQCVVGGGGADLINNSHPNYVSTVGIREKASLSGTIKFQLISKV